jgi:hypothetical protein
MHAIKDRPVVVNGQIVIRPIMVVALTYDHRLMDGREAVTFLGGCFSIISSLYTCLTLAVLLTIFCTLQSKYVIILRIQGRCCLFESSLFWTSNSPAKKTWFTQRTDFSNFTYCLSMHPFSNQPSSIFYQITSTPTLYIFCRNLVDLS